MTRRLALALFFALLALGLALGVWWWGFSWFLGGWGLHT